MRGAIAFALAVHFVARITMIGSWIASASRVVCGAARSGAIQSRVSGHIGY
jgi:hypothetical protein